MKDREGKGWNTTGSQILDWRQGTMANFRASCLEYVPNTTGDQILERCQGTTTNFHGSRMSGTLPDGDKNQERQAVTLWPASARRYAKMSLEDCIQKSTPRSIIASRNLKRLVESQSQMKATSVHQDTVVCCDMQSHGRVVKALICALWYNICI